MAKINYLISGLPGTGKTSVCAELQARGYKAIDADRAFGYQDNNDWLWKEEKIEKALNTSETIFICGSASNRDAYIPRFKKVFILHVDDQTLKHRLLNRTSNNFGKDPDILAKQVARNQGVKEYSIKRGRVVIDATQPIEKVVDDILSQLN
ncbi:MAG TPA: AAA family ATPase [Candidatus Saccharimonadales bacterium]